MATTTLPFKKTGIALTVIYLVSIVIFDLFQIAGENSGAISDWIGIAYAALLLPLLLLGVWRQGLDNGDRRQVFYSMIAFWLFVIAWALYKMWG